MLVTESKNTAEQLDVATTAEIPSGIHGKARFAKLSDKLLKSLKNKKGVFIGAFQGTLMFFDLFAKGIGHMMITAPSRAGKTICFILPVLFHATCFGYNIFINAPKGEILKICGRWLKFLGYTIINIDPFSVSGEKASHCNFLLALVEDIKNNKGKYLHMLVLTFSKSIISKPKDIKEPFFFDGAIKLIAAVMLGLAVFKPSQCHLPGIFKILWGGTEELSKLAELMQRSKRFGGLLSYYGIFLAYSLKPEYIKTFAPMLDIAQRAITIYDPYTDFAKHFIKADISLSDIVKHKKMFIIVTIPEDKQLTHNSANSLFTTAFIEAFSALEKPNPTLMVLEELGNMPRIPNFLKLGTLLPGKGVRVVMVLQAEEQLEDTQGKIPAEIIKKQVSIRIAWEIREQKDKEEWSKRLGRKTAKDYSQNFDTKDPNQPWKFNVSEKGQDVMSAHQVGLLPRTKALISISGEHPILADTVPFYQVKEFRDRAVPDPNYDGYPEDEPVIYQLEETL